MATADTASATDTASPAAQALQRFNALSQRQKMAGAAALALAIALLVGVWLWSRAPDYAVLFSNLEERDGGAIVTALQQQNVPYRISANGSAILVPSETVHDLRLRLAAQGLPKGGMVGFEVMENQRLGVSQFLEQVNFQRALEGELGRTIQAISSVSAARVHLAMPKQTGFLRDEQKPSASVMVTLYPGRVMDASQVAGVVHLISSSVPHMANERVSVVDQNGNLLTQGADPLRNAGLDATQISYVREVEAGFIRRIENILAPIFGEGNYKAQVAAELDFNQVEQTAETFRPNPSPDQAIRSQQTTEQQTRDLAPGGVPGALTNQPPVPATAPIVNPNPGGGIGPDGVSPLNSNRSATLNYELDRTVQHTRQAPGQIKRLSVAVVVNQRTETQPNGTTKVVPLPEEEITRITNLVREAMGYNQARGDSLNVSSAPFAAVSAGGDAVPLWKDPEMLALGAELGRYLLLALAFAFVYFGVIRPLIKAVSPPPPPAAAEEAEGTDAEEDDEDVIVDLSGARVLTFDEKLARARELAKADPKMVANLIKEWMGSKEEGKK